MTLEEAMIRQALTVEVVAICEFAIQEGRDMLTEEEVSRLNHIEELIYTPEEREQYKEWKAEQLKRMFVDIT